MLNQISIDKSKIDNGVWVNLHNSKFLIASVDSRAFKNEIFKYRNTPMTDQLFCKILANTILLDWSDVKEPNGSFLQYSKDFAEIALLTNADVRSLVDHVSTNLKYFSE